MKIKKNMHMFFECIFALGLISKAICMDNTRIEITEKMHGITIDISYLKPEGVEVIPVLPRSSIKIEKLVINGNKQIRGRKPLLWLAADEEYGKLNAMGTTTAESLETIDMYWSLGKKGEKYILEYSSLIDDKPTLFQIPENAKNMTLTYRIRYPDNTFSPVYTKKVDFTWNIKNVFKKRTVDIYIYGLNENSKSMYDDKTLIYSAPASYTITKEDISKGMDLLYTNLSLLQKKELKVTLDKAYTYVNNLKQPIDFEGSIDFIDSDSRQTPFIGFVFSIVDESEK